MISKNAKSNDNDCIVVEKRSTEFIVSTQFIFISQRKMTQLNQISRFPDIFIDESTSFKSPNDKYEMNDNGQMFCLLHSWVFFFEIWLNIDFYCSDFRMDQSIYQYWNSNIIGLQWIGTHKPHKKFACVKYEQND